MSDDLNDLIHKVEAEEKLQRDGLKAYPSAKTARRSNEELNRTLQRLATLRALRSRNKSQPS